MPARLAEIKCITADELDPGGSGEIKCGGCNYLTNSLLYYDDPELGPPRLDPEFDEHDPHATYGLCSLCFTDMIQGWRLEIPNENVEEEQHV